MYFLTQVLPYWAMFAALMWWAARRDFYVF